MTERTKNIALLSILIALVEIGITVPAVANDNFEEIRCAKNGAPTYLLAHGLSGSPYEFHFIAREIIKNNQDHGVWRTQVAKIGTIEKRAGELNDFMGKAQAVCDTPERSVVAIGYSKGGLDLRTIVGSYKTKNLLKAVFTIATPHLGHAGACNASDMEGVYDLCGHLDDPGKASPMMDFNKRHPASEFAAAGIPLNLYYFECQEGNDGVVAVKSQKWDGADSSYLTVIKGGTGWHEVKNHSSETPENCQKQQSCEPELCNSSLIGEIMSKYQSTIAVSRN